MRVVALLLALMVVPLAAAPADAGEKPQETRAQDDPIGTEEQESPEDTARPEFEEEVVVVGSRARPRSVTASPVPVDAIPAREIVSQGDTDLGNQLRAVMPSFNVNTQPISDAGIVVRPANLRNLAPDHTLVLVNGKRRHRAAVIHWGGNGVADGAQGPDIAVIPSIALRQVEVLRDGASAQYGSDAIAGVLNFLLKDARSGGSIEVRGGLFGAGDRGGTYGGVDGGSYGFAGNVGLPLGRTGFANLSLEYGNAAPTDRSIQRSDGAALAAAGNTAVRDPVQVWGAPRVDDDLKLLGNFGHLFSSGLQLYSHLNYASKSATGGFFFRNPNTRLSVFSADGGRTLLVGDALAALGAGSAGCPTVAVAADVPDAAALRQVFADPDCFSFQELFPGGFTPQFGGALTDAGAVAGVRGVTAAGLIWDAAASVGANTVDFFIDNTVNASLGPASPVSFDPGLYRQQEVSVSLDLSYAVNGMIDIAAGAEWRDEQFEIGLGDMPSWEIGPYAAQGFSAGSNGFPGFSPIAAGHWSRANMAGYGDLEVRGRDGRWLVGSAVRIERFEDFGTTMNSKLSGRVQLTDPIALRASVSSGFRAPTPGQQNAFNVSTQYDVRLMDLVNNGTIPSTSAVARLRGGRPLQPERSINYAAGVVIDQAPFTLTVDYFRIDLADRLALTELFALTPAEVDRLVAEGVTSAGNLTNFRFFTNDFATITQGVDLVSTWRPPALGGRTALSAALNHTDTAVTRFNPRVLGASRIRRLEEALPRNRWNVSVQQRAGGWDLLARLNYYGGWLDDDDSVFFAGRPILDVEAAWPVAAATTLAFGARNALDTYPDENPNARATGERYSEYTPWGFGGAYYYVRLTHTWRAAP